MIMSAKEFDVNGTDYSITITEQVIGHINNLKNLYNAAYEDPESFEDVSAEISSTITEIASTVEPDVEDSDLDGLIQEIMKTVDKKAAEIEKELSNTDPPKKITNYSLKKIEALILHFKKTSNVFIIRTPVVKKFYHFENKYSPNFNNMIDSISEKYKVHYFDLNKNINFSTDLKFYDLYHLNKRFSKSATKNVEKIIDSIKINRFYLPCFILL